MAWLIVRWRAGVCGVVLGVLALLGCILAGCFPVELDVSNGAILIARGEGVFIFDAASGGVTRVAAAADKEQPIAARFAPGGKEALIISKVPSDSMDDMFRLSVVPRAGGAGREILRTTMAMYAAYSPDGSQVAVLRGSATEDPNFQQKLPELVVVPAAGGEPRTVAQHVGPLIRWFADSKRMVVFDLAKKVGDDRYDGSISILNVADGKLTPLATAAAQQGAFVDLSPDNKKMLFTALSAVKVGGALPEPEKYANMKLFELDLTSGEVQDFDIKPSCAIFSPRGQQILLVVSSEEMSMDTMTLEVADPTLKNPVAVATDVYHPMSMGGDEVYYPGWLDEKTVFYFVHKPVYGTTAKNVELFAVGTDGAGRRCLQPQIDAGVAKASAQ